MAMRDMGDRLERDLRFRVEQLEAQVKRLASRVSALETDRIDIQTDEEEQ